MKNNTIAIIQARMGSSRMKGKSLISLNGRPLILHVVNSVQKLDFVNQTIVATTTLEEDDPIVTLCKANNIKFYRGDALNVFKRFIDASSSFQENDTIVRITADNPLNWINITKKLFEIHKNNNNDYTCIHGLSHIVSEFIKVGALRDLDNRFELTKFDKEHVTPFFRKNKSFFKVEMLDPDFMGLRQDLDNFLTLDVFEDFLRFEKIFEKKLNNNFIKLYSWLEKNENKTNSKKKEETVTVNLFGTPVGENYPIYIIAEIGQNHNGDMIMAKKLIDIAVKTGANAVKFQKRDIPSELTKEAFYKPYDNPNSFGKTYGEHRVFLELNEAQHKELKEYANIKGITYFCTPCDVSSVELLERIIKAHTNPHDVVLDIFNGSGSTTIACANTQRDFLGCELDKEYYDKSLKRIDELTGIGKFTSNKLIDILGKST